MFHYISFFSFKATVLNTVLGLTRTKDNIPQFQSYLLKYISLLILVSWPTHSRYPDFPIFVIWIRNLRKREINIIYNIVKSEDRREKCHCIWLRLMIFNSSCCVWEVTMLMHDKVPIIITSSDVFLIPIKMPVWVLVGETNKQANTHQPNNQPKIKQHKTPKPKKTTKQPVWKSL